MPLPPRQEYDLKGAAAYLGCGTEDVLYYLHKGMLRLAIATDYLDFDYLAPLNELPPRVQQEITEVLEYGVDIMKPPTVDLVPDKSLHFQFLYLNHLLRHQIMEAAEGEVVQCFQTFTGEQVTAWLNGELNSGTIKRIYLHNEDGWIKNTVVPAEELDRLLHGGAVSSDEPKSPQAAFVLPNKPDETAITLVDYGNRYFKEKNQIPTLDQFIVYLLDHGSEIDFRRLNPEKNTNKGDMRYSLNGKLLAYRNMKRRFNTYLRSDNDQN